LTVVDLFNNALGVLVVNSASEGVASAQKLLDGTLKSSGERSGFHNLGAFNNLIESQVSVVLDVLDLLSISGFFVEFLDQDGRGRGEDGDGGSSVLDSHFDHDLNTLPLVSFLGYIITDLLGVQTKGTHRGGQRRGSQHATNVRSQ